MSTTNTPTTIASARGPRGRAGFTMLEVLVTMAMVGILASIGYISLPRDRFAAREAARVLAADLNRARSEAVRLNTNVALQFGGGADCGVYCLYADPARSGAPDGDLDGDGTTDVAPTLQRRGVTADFPRVQMSASGFGDTSRIWFDVRGLPRVSTGAFMANTARVAVRPTGADAGFVVTLEPQGRVQVVSE